MTKPNNLGAAMAGGNGERRPGDFYPTPPEVTLALLESGVLLPDLPIWECACGEGALAEVLRGAGRSVVATDLFDRGYGEPGHDFTRADKALAPIVVTNPPFVHAKAFIVSALRLEGVEQVALLLKATYWNAGDRYELLNNFPPTFWMPITWRVDFTGAGKPAMDLCWAVWSKFGRYGDQWATFLKPLRRPGRQDNDLFAEAG